MAQCSYDVHLQEIFGSLIIGNTVVLLHPYGHMDVSYVIDLLVEKQITYMQCVPTYLNQLTDFLTCNIRNSIVLRTLDIGGKCFT